MITLEAYQGQDFNRVLQIGTTSQDTPAFLSTDTLTGFVWDGQTQAALGTIVGADWYTGLDSVTVADGGSGYSPVPSVTITGGGADTQATLSATVEDGVITAINIVDPGSGYDGSVTTIVITDSTGTSATATATQALGWQTGLVVVEIDADQTASLDAAGQYRFRVDLARDTGSSAVIDCLLKVYASPGAATQATLAYCGYQDMLNLAPWITEVQDVDTDQEGFYSQRLDARNWMDWAITNAYRGAFVGLFEMHSYAAFAFGYAGWRRSLGPSPSLITYLEQNLLILRPQIIRACARFAIGQVGMAQMGSNNAFVQYGQWQMAMAEKEIMSITAEIDLNSDGVGELFVILGQTNTLMS